MTNKRYWHKEWSRDGSYLVHSSGLKVEFDEDLGWSATEDTAEAWSAFELARGAPLHDLPARMQRLCREAAEWSERNP
ncbi:hypothetical protein [Diaphorobacter caeni]|uniref:hypothetical protein n=1 Tax=Diaphorobacter caeni TaxID=2784387 RepID=UPI00188F74A5|nr:hypothetical protein [Diaphorobacter caeni]MBF5006021.1 hypothetical protein [Diaphorobacter caeni]